MFDKCFQNIHEDIFDLSIHLDHQNHKSIQIIDSKINALVIPSFCEKLCINDSSISKIVIVGNKLQYLSCSNIELKEIECSETLTCLKTLYLDNNQLTNLNLKITGKPYHIYISNNKINKIAHKLPFCWDIECENNIIPEEDILSNYIDYSNTNC